MGNRRRGRRGWWGRTLGAYSEQKKDVVVGWGWGGAGWQQKMGPAEAGGAR